MNSSMVTHLKAFIDNNFCQNKINCKDYIHDYAFMLLHIIFEWCGLKSKFKLI